VHTIKAYFKCRISHELLDMFIELSCLLIFFFLRLGSLKLKAKQVGEETEDTAVT
jgi:hypothetical protein